MFLLQILIKQFASLIVKYVYLTSMPYSDGKENVMLDANLRLDELHLMEHRFENNMFLYDLLPSNNPP